MEEERNTNLHKRCYFARSGVKKNLIYDNLEVLGRLIADSQDPDQKKIVQFKVLLIHARTNTLLKPLYANSGDKKFTPFRSNLFQLNVLMNALANEPSQSEDRARKDKFLKDYGFICKCNHFFHSKVHIEEASRIFKMYSSMNKKQKSQSLRVLLQNFKTDNEGNKKSFAYSLAGVQICKHFFMFIHDTTVRVIKRLQNICKNLESFFQDFDTL
jgi:hypothetical protein